MPAGAQGAITVYPTNDTNLVIDIDGYFAPGLCPFTRCRPACAGHDRRTATARLAGSMPVSILQSRGTFPSAQAYVLNATVVPQNGGSDGI